MRNANAPDRDRDSDEQDDTPLLSSKRRKIEEQTEPAAAFYVDREGDSREPHGLAQRGETQDEDEYPGTLPETMDDAVGHSWEPRTNQEEAEEPAPTMQPGPSSRNFSAGEANAGDGNQHLADIDLDAPLICLSDEQIVHQIEEQREQTWNALSGQLSSMTDMMEEYRSLLTHPMMRKENQFQERIVRELHDVRKIEDEQDLLKRRILGFLDSLQLNFSNFFREPSQDL
ncbi:hypothetical protein DFS34DRAFT_289897 [Phlyctochytrium arcticum]|nr:hypothetical protein DFS34DRAFT_289897 [Phlyctochytrium arcticum]